MKQKHGHCFTRELDLTRGESPKVSSSTQDLPFHHYAGQSASAKLNSICWDLEIASKGSWEWCQSRAGTTEKP